MKGFEKRQEAMVRLKEEFVENHRDAVGVFETSGDDTLMEEETPATTKRDPFITWMLDAQALSPDVFSRVLRFKREFSTDGRPFTRAMEMIDAYVESSVLSLKMAYPNARVDDSWVAGAPAAVSLGEDVPLLPSTEPMDTADASGEVVTDVVHGVDDVDHEEIRLDPFPLMPLELLPVEHFVLGLWTKATEQQHQQKRNDEETENDAAEATTSNERTDSFSLPWLSPAWVDMLSATPAPPKKKQRAKVWRGKNLAMIVYGADEKQTWADKIAAFLKRARSALGNRSLDRTAWGGSIVDSLIGANLTQNVSDVLSSQAFMNLAARFPYKAETAKKHNSSLYIRRIVTEMFNRIVAEHEEGKSDDESERAQAGEMASRPKRAGAGAKMKLKKAKKAKSNSLKAKKQNDIDKALAYGDPPECERTADQVDWYAVLDAPLVEVVKCIRCRGMHWMLARRIKGILRRIMSHRGCLSLEFLRNVPTKEAREYLLALDGMGVKTTSCVLLLALHRTDFPVDVNVGRIMARLGWVPLESETALEELAQYAPEPAVYTFLRERLNSFSVELLYELHYHMITLGKVFCGKRMPNCGACPLRDICEYAKQGGKCVDRPDGHSGLASLQPENAPCARPITDIEDIAEPQAKTSTVHANVSKGNSSAVLNAIISAGKEWDRNGRPMGTLATNVLLLSAATSREDVQMAYVRLSRVVHPDKNPSPDAATAFNYITTARQIALNITNDDVLAQNIEVELEEMLRWSKEDAEDPIDEVTGLELSEHVVRASKVRCETVGWTVTPEMMPGELIEALGERARAEGCIMIPTESNATSLDDIKGDSVKVAILVPCYNAMNRKFPLHGTYFQVNEVFLDEISSVMPITRPKSDFATCKRVRILLGTSIVSIARGMGRAQVTAAFASQRICVRSWNRNTKKPGPLPKWLCPFFPEHIERPLEPEPTPLAKNGRPLGAVANAPALSPVSVLPASMMQSPKLADIEAATPAGSIEHALLQEFHKMFRGKEAKRKMPGFKRMYTGAPSDDKRVRRRLFPPIGRGNKCGFCKYCLNPQMKQACLTRRNEMRMTTLPA